MRTLQRVNVRPFRALNRLAVVVLVLVASLAAPVRPDAAGAQPDALVAVAPASSVAVAPASSAAGSVAPLSAHAAASAPFQAVNPTRLADTRPGSGTADGQVAGGGATTQLAVPVSGRFGVPSDAAAVTANVTVTGADAEGFVTVYPCGQAPPWASNLNYAAATTVANLVTVQLGSGALCVYSTSAVHVVVDLLGWFGPGAPIVASTPARLADTRPGAFTVDGLGAGGGPLQMLEVIVAGRAGVPASAEGVVANVTVTEPVGPGYVTVYPCGQPFPLASNVNFSGGQTVANLVMTGIGSGGSICLFSSVAAHLVVDVTGWMPAGSVLKTISPQRLADTRVPGGVTVDNRLAGVGKIRGGVYLTLAVTGRGGVPAASAAAILNVTVTEPEEGGFVTAFPCGRARPNASNVNMSPGQTVPNLVLAQIGAAGEVCLYTSGRSHLVVDLAGWLPAAAPPAAAAGPTMLAGCPVFPASNPWNTDISGYPVRAESAGWVSAVGATKVHPDFGSNPSYGIPFTVVGADEALTPTTFVEYGDESDPGPYPLPLDTPVEGGSDRHAIALQQDTCRLYELFRATPGSSGWVASNGAAFDLRSNALRPDGWTSADAAGLPILAGLVRYEEVRTGVITHALRFTVPRTQRGFVHPATHFAGNTASAPPMGARFRLPASFDSSGYKGDARIIVEALKRYGMIVSDNGSGWYISGATDSRWNDNDLNQLKTIPGSAFEVVDTGPILTS